MQRRERKKTPAAAAAEGGALERRVIIPSHVRRLRAVSVWDFEANPASFEVPLDRWAPRDDGAEDGFSLSFTMERFTAARLDFGAFDVSVYPTKVSVRGRRRPHGPGRLLETSVWGVAPPAPALVDSRLVDTNRFWYNACVHVRRDYIRVAVFAQDGGCTAYVSGRPDDDPRDAPWVPRLVNIHQGKLCDVLLGPLHSLEDCDAFRTADSAPGGESAHRGPCTDVLQMLELPLDECRRVEAPCAEVRLASLAFLALRTCQGHMRLKCVWSKLPAVPTDLIAELQPPPQLYIQSLRRALLHAHHDNRRLRRKLRALGGPPSAS